LGEHLQIVRVLLLYFLGVLDVLSQVGPTIEWACSIGYACKRKSFQSHYVVLVTR